MRDDITDNGLSGEEVNDRATWMRMTVVPSVCQGGSTLGAFL